MIQKNNINKTQIESQRSQGIKNRRLAHKENLKKKIVDAARTLFKKKRSWQSVTIREIAHAINYSLPTIYEFFENKEDLLKALQQEGYALLCTSIKNTLESTHPDQQEVLTIVNQAYWDFAWEYPELYYAMHDNHMDLNNHKDAIDYIRTQVNTSLQNAEKNNKKEALKEEKLIEAIDINRATVHGFVMLSLAGRMEKKKAHYLMKQTVQKILSI